MFCLGEVVDTEEMRRHGFTGWLSRPLRARKVHEAIESARDPVVEPAIETTAADLTAGESTPAGEAVPDSQELPLLLAEDNPVNQKVASIMLAKLGHEVEVVDNGAEAVAALARRRYRLVLMDVQMPVMDGYEAVRRIRMGEDGVLEPNVPVVALTAHAMKGDRQRCLDAGMDDYLAKPIDNRALGELLDRFLGATEPTPA
jgi:CheY-like chemotaxis protein